MSLVLVQDGLVLIGSESCGPCNQAAAWLESRGVFFHKSSIARDAELQAWLAETTGQRTVPQFFLDGKWLPGGFSQVRLLVGQGKIAWVRVTQLDQAAMGGEDGST